MGRQGLTTACSSKLQYSFPPCSIYFLKSTHHFIICYLFATSICFKFIRSLFAYLLHSSTEYLQHELAIENKLSLDYNKHLQSTINEYQHSEILDFQIYILTDRITSFCQLFCLGPSDWISYLPVICCRFFDLKVVWVCVTGSQSKGIHTFLQFIWPLMATHLPTNIGIKTSQ